jgi:hypothetical protein
MKLVEYYVVFPEGEAQEIESGLRIDELVDLNGRPLSLPVPTVRMIAYRVVKVRQVEERSTLSVLHYLELVPSYELAAYTIG